MALGPPWNFIITLHRMHTDIEGFTEIHINSGEKGEKEGGSVYVVKMESTNNFSVNLSESWSCGRPL